ncbi:hypothetical protein GCM10023149_48430 [Mucilaginibacter gynuensis]|uniref:Tape measure protein N-terminal domain-containing protein n=1 Tax=Mucilaginibacter gynuensis TaxID=1302236 RepID=A0ABP8HFC4_9SPHI
MGVSVLGGPLSFDATINGSQFQQQIKAIERDLNRLASTTEERGAELDNIFKKAAVSAASFFSIQQAAGFVNQLIQVRGEFEQLEVAYSTMLQSKQRGDALFRETIQLAATTPFNLTEVAKSTKQLLAYGVAAGDVTETLRMLGNVAAGVSAPIGDIAYLYGTLKTQGRAYMMDIRQFTGRGIPIIQELAKQFGVTDSEVNKLVESGRVGFPEVEKAFKSLTGQGGIFFNLMEEQSKTLTGRLSNLQDAFDQMLNEIGKSNQDILGGGISLAANLVDNYRILLDVLRDIVVAYGVYKTAVLVETAYTAVAANVKALKAERVAVIELAVDKQKAAGQDLYNATIAKQAAVERYRADTAALIASKERLALAQAENAAAAANINSTNKVTAAKNLQVAASQVLKAEETAEISRKAALTAAGEVYSKTLAVQTATKQAATVATTTLTTAQALSAGATNLLSAAWLKLTNFLKANPFIAVAVAAAAFYHLISQLNAETESLTVTTTGYLSELQKERDRLKDVVDQAKIATAGSKERKDAIKKINDEYGTYLPNLLQDAATNKDLADAYDLLNGKIRDNLDLRFRQKNVDKANETYKAIADPAFDELMEQIRGAGKTTNFAQASKDAEKVVDQLAKLYDKRREQLNQAKDLTAINAEILKTTQSFNKKYGINQGAFDNVFGNVGEIAAARSRQNEMIQKTTDRFGNKPEATKEKKLTKEQQAELDRMNRFQEGLKDAFKNFDQLMKDARGKTNFEKIQEALRNKSAELTATLAPDEKQINAINGRLKTVAVQLDKYEVKSDKKAEDKLKNDQQRFLKDLADQELDTRIKGMTKNEGELTRLREKFDKQRAEANKLKLGDGVIKRINNEERAATGTIKEEQEVEALKKTIEQKKAAYGEYENWKKTLDRKSADEQFADLLKSGASYKDYLTNLAATLPKGALSTAYEGLADTVKKEQNEVSKGEAGQYLDLRKQAQSYQAKRLEIVKNGIADAEKLRQKGYSAEADQQLKNVQDQLTDLDVENVKKLDSYQELFDGIHFLSNKRAKQDVADVKAYIDKALANKEITQKAYDKINNQLEDFKIDRKNKIPQELKVIASGFSNLATEVGKFDQGLGNALATLGNIVSSVADIKTNFDLLNSKDTDFLGKISAGFGLVGAGISVISTVASLFGGNDAQKQYQSDLQLKQMEAINKALERQLALTKDIYGPGRLDAYKKNLADIEKAQLDAQAKLSGRLSFTGIKSLDDEIAKFNNGEGYDSWILTQKTIKQLNEKGFKLDGSTPIEQLQDLMNSGKLDEQTAAIVQNLIDLGDKSKETFEQMQLDIAGIDFRGLNNSIKSVFESGETSVEKFADAIESSIRSAFANAFQRKEVEEAMKPFYDQLLKAGDDGVFTQEEIDQLRDQKDKIAAILAERAKAYEAIIGKDGDAQNSLQGGIKASLTEDTGGLIVGQFNGLRLISIESLSLAKQQAASMADFIQHVMDSNVRKIALLEQIEVNTRPISRLENIEKSLASIDRKVNATANGLAANGR